MKKDNVLFIILIAVGFIPIAIPLMISTSLNGDGNASLFFILLFIIVVVICSICLGKFIDKDIDNMDNFSSNANNLIEQDTSTSYCKKCGNALQMTEQYCKKCGTKNANAIKIEKDTSPIVQTDINYLKSEKQLLNDLIKEEINKQGEDVSTFITNDLNLKRNIFLAIFGVLTFIFIIMYFFNYSLILCLILEVVVAIIYAFTVKKFTVINIIQTKAIKNPDESVSNIIKNLKQEKHESHFSYSIKISLVLFVVILIPCIIFMTPKTLYKSYGDGYMLFKYTKGIITPKEETLVIPDTHNGKKVLAIGDAAFKNSNIQKVVLPDSLESIKYRAFYNANNITEIDIPSSVVEIRKQAFASCKNLKTVNLHEGIKDIRAGAFEGDLDLKNITLPNSLEYLGASAFLNCKSLVEITIPEKVTEINGSTFESCTSLETVNLHNNIISIHGAAFKYDINIKEIDLPSKITEVRGETFEGCTGLRSIHIPDGVTRIGGHAFYGCTNLSSVYVPSSVKEIGSSAFRRCYSLQNISIPYGAVVNERAFKESPTKVNYY